MKTKLLKSMTWLRLMILLAAIVGATAFVHANIQATDANTGPATAQAKSADKPETNDQAKPEDKDEDDDGDENDGDDD